MIGNSSSPRPITHAFDENNLSLVEKEFSIHSSFKIILNNQKERVLATTIDPQLIDRGLYL
jgi:hypothetical protein